MELSNFRIKVTISKNCIFIRVAKSKLQKPITKPEKFPSKFI